MRILFLSLAPVAGWGGSEELWADTARVALADGHQIWIVPRVDDNGSDASLTELVALGARMLPRESWRDDAGVLRAEVVPPAARAIASTVGAIFVSAGGSISELVDPAVVELFVELVQQSQPTPVTATIQLVRETDLLGDAARSRARSMLGLLATLVVPANRSLQVLERTLATKIDRAVVVPSPIRRDLAGILPWPDTPLPTMACVARLNPVQKGQDLLLEVLSDAAWRPRDWHLTFVGRGMGRNHLEELAAYYRIADKVTFAGFQHDMTKVWLNNQLLVLPSREESLPIAIMEAMFCGRPCLVTDVGDNSRLIEHGVTGYVAAGDRPIALAMALETAWSHRDDWRAAGLRAHAMFTSMRDPVPGRTVLSLLTSSARGTPADEGNGVADASDVGSDASACHARQVRAQPVPR